jgi:hypothetical protein
LSYQKHILFVTSTNLASNPRCRKEIDLALRQKYKVSYIAFSFDNWTKDAEKTIQKELAGARGFYIPGNRTPFFLWFFSSLVERITRRIYPFATTSLPIAAYAHSKRSFLLNRFLQNKKGRFDLIVAHNLAALFPSFLYAKRNTIAFGFDVEDFHPGEVIVSDAPSEKRRRELLLKNILPHAVYISYASPLIGEYTLKLLLHTYKNAHFFIPNCFNAEEFQEPKKLAKDQRLKLVWFSQHISYGRGLEELLEAVEPIKDLVELHLIGQEHLDFYSRFIRNRNFVFTYSPMPQADLHNFLATFDVGLAIEMSKADVNRNIALTNKLFAYMQAGLYVLATNTPSQQLFIQQYPWGGEITGQNSEQIRMSLIKLIKHKEVIRERAVVRFNRSKELSYKNQSQRLINAWNTARKK